MNARTTKGESVVSFKRASREGGTPLRISIGGPSGSGKTLSALRMAAGLQRVLGGQIAVIDTENRRSLQYADRFNFMHGDLQPPFSPHRYLAAIRDAEAAGATIIIIDSASHEHEGEGGILEMHEAELEKMAGSDWQKRDRVKFTAWIRPKAEHGAFVRHIQRGNSHLIFCFRAKEKMALLKNAQGKIEPVSQGWVPVCADRLDYEMTLGVILPPKGEGRPKLDEGATKLDTFAFGRAIVDGQQITEETGEILARWSRGEGPEARPAAQPAAKPAAAKPTATEPAPDNDLPTRSKALLQARDILARLQEAQTQAAYNAVIEGDEKRLEWYRENRLEWWKVLEDARQAAFNRCSERAA